MTQSPPVAVQRTRPPAKEGMPPVSTLRGLEDGERVSHWIKIHLSSLEKWNTDGWRWVQIAQAIQVHIGRPVTRNKLTGMVTMIRKGKLARDVEQASIGDSLESPPVSQDSPRDNS